MLGGAHLAKLHCTLRSDSGTQLLHMPLSYADYWLQMGDPSIFAQHYGEPCWQQFICAGIDWKFP